MEYSEGRTDDVLYERLIALMTPMLLYMNDQKLEEMTYTQVVPVGLRGLLAERAGKSLQKYEIEVKVRKVD